MSNDKKEAWILDTQLFQRIAKVPETPYDQLAEEYDSIVKKKFKRGAYPLPGSGESSDQW